MNEAEINNLFQKQKYHQIHLLLNQETLKKKYPIFVNFYLYFLNGIFGQIEKQDEQYKILKKYYKNNKDELFYQFALKCSEMVKTRGSFYINDDVNRFLQLAIQENHNHARANFLLGKRKIIKHSGIYNFKRGFEHIHKAIALNSEIIEDYKTYLLQIRIDSYGNDSKPLYSKREILFFIKEIKSLPEKYKNNDYYFKLLEIYIIIKNYDVAFKIGTKINIQGDFYHKNKFNQLMLKLYSRKRFFKQAIKLASEISSWEKAKCYLSFKKYSKAAESFIEYLYFPKKQIVDTLIVQQIAISFYMDSQFDKALEYIEKNITNNETREIYHKYYFDSLNLKGLIYSAMKEYKKSIACFEQAYYAIKDNNGKLQYKTELEKTIFNLISVNADYHIDWIEGKKKSYTAIDEITDLKDFENILGIVDSIFYFNTQPKDNFKRFCKELIVLNSHQEKNIKTVEDKVLQRENECRLFGHKTIEKLSRKAIIKFPNNEHILSELAFRQYKIKKYNASLKNFKQLINLNNTNLSYYNYISLIYEEKNQLNNSFKYIKKCIMRSEYHSQSTKIYENFLRIIDKIIQKNPGSRKHKLLTINAQEAADELMKKIIVFDSNLSRLSSSGINEIHNIELFKYKPFNKYTIDSILNSYLFFSTLNKLNDPFDLPFLYSGKFKLYKDFIINNNDIKIFCSSLEENNTLMWSHYADSHKGLCIGYKIKSLPCNIGWDKIKYVHHNLSHERLQKEDDLITTGLYSKNSNWSYEKEVRLICYKEKTDCFQYAYPILPKDKSKLIEAYITQIIIGYKFPETQLDLLIHVLKDLNKKRKKHSLAKIKLYRITLDKEKPFNLLKESMKY